MRSVISPISSRKMVPVVGDLELAGLVAVGAGEAALDVPEQLGFEERFGEAGAVDRHEGAVRPRAQRVDARATSSLPTPLSPVIRTLASERATRSISCSRSIITGLIPINRPLPWPLPLPLWRIVKSKMSDWLEYVSQATG